MSRGEGPRKMKKHKRFDRFEGTEVNGIEKLVNKGGSWEVSDVGGGKLWSGVIRGSDRCR